MMSFIFLLANVAVFVHVIRVFLGLDFDNFSSILLSGIVSILSAMLFVSLFQGLGVLQ